MTGKELFECERPDGSAWKHLDEKTRDGWESAAAGVSPFFPNGKMEPILLDGRRARLLHVLC